MPSVSVYSPFRSSFLEPCWINTPLLIQYSKTGPAAFIYLLALPTPRNSFTAIYNSWYPSCAEPLLEISKPLCLFHITASPWTQLTNTLVIVTHRTRTSSHLIIINKLSSILPCLCLLLDSALLVCVATSSHDILLVLSSGLKRGSYVRLHLSATVSLTSVYLSGHCLFFPR